MDDVLRFKDHEVFQRCAAITVVVLPAVAALFGLAFNRPELGMALACATVPVAALGIARGFELRDVGRLALAVAGAFILNSQRGQVGVAGFAVAVGLALLVGQAPRRVLWGMAVAGPAMILALWTLSRIHSSLPFAELAPPLRLAASAAGFGFVSLFALAMRHVEVGATPIGREYRHAQRTTSGEVHELVVRGYGVWKRSQPRLANEPAERAEMDETALRLFRTARQWGLFDADRDPHREAALVSRMESLEQRLRAAADPVAHKEYERAYEALRTQKAHFEELAVRRDRVLAKLHSDLASMEAVRPQAA